MSLSSGEVFRPAKCQARGCDAPIEQKRTGKPKLYCCNACRQRAKRDRYRLRAQAITHADIKPRGPPPDLHTYLTKALKTLEKQQERNGVKELVEELRKIVTYQQKQEEQPKQDDSEIKTEKQRHLAKQFADYLAQQAQ